MDLPDRLLVQGDAVRRAYSVLEDGPSREEFVAQLRWRLLLDFDGLPPPVTHPVYFPPDLYEVNDAEVFVDCGAYDGDTVRTLLGLTPLDRGTIFAFEPDSLTFARLKQYHANLPQVVKDRIHVARMAVGAHAGTISFAMMGTPASAAGSGESVVECVRLDDALKGMHPTIVKMDIEGSEIDALNGAAQTIRTHRPILAVSAYHTQNHFWEIPQLIKDFSSDYHIFLRPHLIEVWELVCYAVPSHRLRST
jgi:FkbM family methyltransferase